MDCQVTDPYILVILENAHVRVVTDLKVINDEVQTMRQMLNEGDDTYVRNIVRNGCSGMAGLNDSDLAEEYYQKFDEIIRIKK